jgi:hypothetical protein
MLPAPAAVVVVRDDYGGSLREFAERVLDYQRHHVVVRVMGECASSCTLVTALRDDRFCVGPEASLEFHQAYLPNRFDPLDTSIRSEDGVRVMMRFYPPKLRAWIARQGGLTKDLIVLKGAELRRLFRLCG